MKKTFNIKNESVNTQKPTSQKDILDFFDEESEMKNDIKTETITTPVESKNHPIKTLIEELEHPQEVRQTFMIGINYLEKTKNYVHMKKMNGQYEYTQKDLLHAALDLLFNGINIPQRPESVKDREKDRALRIKNGKNG